MLTPGVLLANSEEENGDLLATVFSAIEDEDWVTADHYASQISDTVGVDLVTWERLRQGEGDWAEYHEFLDQNGDWPGLKRLRRMGEAEIPAGADPASVRAYFKNILPQTGRGALRLAEAYAAQGRNAEARGEAIRAWTKMSLKEYEEIALYKKFKGVLAQHNLRRLDNLLWRGLTREAGRMLDRVTSGQAKLAKARIGLQRASKTVDSLIGAVPQNLQSDAGLAYDRFQWRVKKGRWDDAQEFLARQTGSVEKLGRPEAWASRRRGFARRAMRAGNTDLAYWLASQHDLTSGSNYADLEWLSGYISLTQMDAPKQALAHFKSFKDAVKSPISLGRAGYWLGRAYEKMGAFDEAAKAYGLGAQYQTSFYGQLAAEKLGSKPDFTLSGKEKTLDWRQADFLKTAPIRAGILFHYADDPARMRWFFSHVAKGLDRTGLSQLADLALELDRPNVALAVAKQAARRGIILPKSYFPVTDLATYSVDVAPEIAMSIARRESELSPTAISPAGARGLMQVMPATARKVAKDIGVSYSKARLTSDWRYNAQLGTAYLGGLLKIFEGSYILAFAGYNAGPNRAEAWIEEFGDPRDSLVDQVNWIEHIPYRETRNYVMRVMESLHVYRARLKGKTPPLQLTQDLTRG
ncbi:MAG: lytic transglycosylase domain-containing protein [Amylibacter sp.]|nr:lytic transglycosylase domain-containing protein [Amylibacter sp.]